MVTVAHTRQDYRKLWTTRLFPGDFVLKLEFRASPNADSGIFVREPQLQCRDFIIAGPFATLAHYRPLDWNEIVVTVKGGPAHATCNGEIIMDAMPVPATGPIGLESDHGQMEYRHIQVKELREVLVKQPLVFAAHARNLQPCLYQNTLKDAGAFDGASLAAAT